jgi:hypothetical protein
MKKYKHQVIQFMVMFVVGMLFNPMNMLAYRVDDLYLSLTLFYSGILMASNMIWAHEIIHYISMGHFNKYIFTIGVLLTISSTMILRQQLFVDDTQWLRRMIGHHSTALTTSHKIYNKTTRSKVKKLATDIITSQENEILVMKSLL